MADLRRYPASAATLRTLPPPQPSPAADAGASCEGGGRWIVVATTVAESFTEGNASEQERQAPLFRRSAPSLAGRSPQRGRAGGGVGNIVDEAEFWFFTFAAIILALFCFASNACCCCAGCSSPTGKGSISAVFHHICSSIYRGRCALSCIGGDFKDATPSPTLPRCGLRPAGEGVVRRVSPHPFTDSFTYT